MPVVYTDPQLKTAATNSGDDTSTNGGGIGSAIVYGTSPGELFPFMSANDVGTVDNAPDLQVQNQKAFYLNGSTTSTLKLCRIFLKNGLVRPSSGVGRVFIVLTNAGDEGKQVRLQENVGGVIVTEAVNTPGGVGAGSATNGAQASVVHVERAQLVDVSGNQSAAMGAVQIWWGANIGTAVLLGFIPPPSRGGQTWSWATAEIQLMGINSTFDTNNPGAAGNDVTTVANRRTAPAGTFSRAYTYATGIVIRLDVNNASLGPGIAQGFWGQQTLQPGMPAADNVQYCWTLGGQTGA
jgi:hypothetical protein